MTHLFKLHLDQDGDLVISVNTDTPEIEKEAIETLQHLENEYSDPRDSLQEILEYYVDNQTGEYIEHASWANIGLTETPAISTELSYSEDGETYVPEDAKLWVDNYYQIRNFTTELISDKKYTFFLIK